MHAQLSRHGAPLYKLERSSIQNHLSTESLGSVCETRSAVEAASTSLARLSVMNPGTCSAINVMTALLAKEAAGVRPQSMEPVQM